MSSPTTQPTSAPAPDSGPEFDFVTWFELNQRLILIGVVVVCVALAGLATVRYLQKERRATAAKELLLLTPPKGPGEAPAPVEAAKLLALGSRFAGTPAGEQAQLLGAGQLFTGGKYAEAQAEFSGFEEKYPNSEWVGVALLGVAASLEAQGKTSEALNAYDRAVAGAGGGFVAQARLAKGRLLAEKQPAEALVLFEEVLKGAAASTYGEQAAQARAKILQLHPNLVPPSTTTNSVVVRPAGATNLVPAALP